MPSLTFRQELELFWENESSKIKILVNVGIGLACAGAIIRIFSPDTSKYFLMIPIGIILLQIGIAYHRMGSFIEEDSIRHREFSGQSRNSRFKDLEEKLDQRLNRIENILNNLQLSPEVQPSDSASQVLVMENCNNFSSLATASQNNTFFFM